MEMDDEKIALEIRALPRYEEARRIIERVEEMVGPPKVSEHVPPKYDWVNEGFSIPFDNY